MSKGQKYHTLDKTKVTKYSSCWDDAQHCTKLGGLGHFKLTPSFTSQPGWLAFPVHSPKFHSTSRGPSPSVPSRWHYSPKGEPSRGLIQEPITVSTHYDGFRIDFLVNHESTSTVSPFLASSWRRFDQLPQLSVCRLVELENGGMTDILDR